MPKKRTTKKLQPPPTRDLMELHLSIYANATHQHDEILAHAEQTCHRVMERARQKLGPLRESSATALAIVQRWAEANPQEFEKQKSVQVAGHRLGFNAGQPGCKLIKPQDGKKTQTWKGFLEVIKTLGSDFCDRYIRTKENPDKDAIAKTFALAAQALPGDQEDDPGRQQAAIDKGILEAAGVTVQADPYFFIELANHKTTPPKEKEVA